MSQLSLKLSAGLLLFTPLVLPTVRADIVVSTIDPIGEVQPSIFRFDETTGTELTSGEIPFPSEELTSPTDIAIGPNGNIFVADASTAKILWFDGQTGAPLPSPQAGGTVGVFTSRATEPTEGVNSFTSLAFGHDGNLYAVNADLDTVDIYDGSTGNLAGTLLDNLTAETPTPTTLASINFSPNGRAYVSDLGASRIYEIDLSLGADQEVVSEFVTSTSNTVLINGVPNLFFPAGITFNQSGDLFVANIFANTILKFDSSGQNPSLFAEITPAPQLPNSVVPGGPPTNFPSDIAFDRDGNLLVAVLGEKNTLDAQGQPQTTEGRVLRFDATTGALIETVIDNLLPASSVALVEDLLPADFNGDGTVDFADYNKWKTEYGDTELTSGSADANGDGLIDAADYTLWRDTLGATGIAAPAASASLNTSEVPEPATLGMVALGLLGGLGCRKFARQKKA